MPADVGGVGGDAPASVAHESGSAAPSGETAATGTDPELLSLSDMTGSSSGTRAMTRFGRVDLNPAQLRDHIKNHKREFSACMIGRSIAGAICNGNGKAADR